MTLTANVHHNDIENDEIELADPDRRVYESFVPWMTPDSVVIGGVSSGSLQR